MYFYFCTRQWFLGKGLMMNLYTDWLRSAHPTGLGEWIHCLLNACLVGHICFFSIISWVETDKSSTSYYRKPYARLKVLQVSEVSYMLVKYNRKLLSSSGLMRCAVHRTLCSNARMEGRLFLLYMHHLCKTSWWLSVTDGRFVNCSLKKESPALCPNILFFSDQ